MNTLSKYDIADIVSHISGSTQPAAEQPSDEASFADLLRKAVENIPSSNAAEKVAESGKSVPGLNNADVETLNKNDSEQELHALFRQAFEKTQGKSNDIFKTQRLEPQRDENPSESVIANLKAALKFGIKDAEISSKKEKLNLATCENEGVDEKIRVATLMQKRPVILGPGLDDKNSRSEAMTTLPSAPPRSIEELPNSDDSRIKSPAVKLEQAIKGNGAEESRFRDSRQEDLVNNAYERSTIDSISVHKSRLRMGDYLGEKIATQYRHLNIDVVIPVPDTSRTAAMQVAHRLGKKYREGFMKNRYIGRTFIMPGQSLREKSVRRKLNAINDEFRGKNVLLVDDSIVRGTTSKQIVEMARESGASKVYFASAAPPVRFPNVYGIDMPATSEFIANNRTIEQINEHIGSDKLFYQTLEDLIRSTKNSNSSDIKFDSSCFNGVYVTGDVTDEYLQLLHEQRNDNAKQGNIDDDQILDIHNLSLIHI